MVKEVAETAIDESDFWIIYRDKQKMNAKQKYIEFVDGAAHMSAIEIIEKLEIENKDLKESRDELLEACKEYIALVNPGSYSAKLRGAIRKAEVLKRIKQKKWKKIEKSLDFYSDLLYIIPDEKY